MVHICNLQFSRLGLGIAGSGSCANVLGPCSMAHKTNLQSQISRCLVCEEFSGKADAGIRPDIANIDISNLIYAISLHAKSSKTTF